MNTLAYPSTSHETILECLFRQDASLSRWFEGDVRESGKSQECGVVAGKMRETHTTGDAKRHPGLVRIRRLQIMLPAHFGGDICL
jgi:hypothetical protein